MGTLGQARADVQARCAGPCAAIAGPCKYRSDDRARVRCHHALVPILHPRTVAFFACACLLPAARAAEIPVTIPAGVANHADGRAPIETLYRAVFRLVAKGWQAEVIAQSEPPGTAGPLPIVALRSPKAGPAVWILAGIHGEEPAGPNAIAAAIEDIAALGASRPVVLMPLLNPQGYARNWRYLNVAVYSEAIDGQSVGDSSHLLPSVEDASRPRAPAASSPEAGAITAFVLRQQADYPVAVSIDLHEDNLIDQGYVYSQGVAGAKDELAITAVNVLRESGVPIKMDGKTRFDEPVERGIIGPVTDSSIDELMSARTLVVGGVVRSGPAAKTVLVLETPAAALPLEKRIAAQAAVLRLFSTYLITTPDGF
jgi:Succinylglutamate desuccinylase / Aspartoacylase family